MEILQNKSKQFESVNKELSEKNEELEKRVDHWKDQF